MSELERWERRYADAEYVFGTEPNAFLMEQREWLPRSGRALAVGDGEGRNGVWLAQHGLDVLSLDFSARAQAKARELARTRGVRLTTELADLATWSWPEATFDVIAVLFVHVAPGERECLFAGIRKALKPGGVLLLEGHAPDRDGDRRWGPPRENLYTRAMLEGAFGDFTELHIGERDEELDEGIRHAGASPLVDLVGRK